MIYIDKNDLFKILDKQIDINFNENVYILYSQSCYDEIIKYFDYKDIELNNDDFGTYSKKTPLRVILLKKYKASSNIVEYNIQKCYVIQKLYYEDIIFME